MSQTISLTLPLSVKTDQNHFGVQPTALELYRLGLLRAASHHLPSVPPSNPWDCLAFRQISHRLIGWDRLYSERTGQEYIFQNYFDESSIGPEVFYELYPRPVPHWIPGPLVTGTTIFSMSEEHPSAGKLGEVGDFQSNETFSSDDVTDGSIITSDDYHEEEGYDLPLGPSDSLPQPPSFLQPIVQTAPMHHRQFDSFGQDPHPFPITHQTFFPSSPCNSHHRKSHMIESSFDGLVNSKRRKTLPA